MDIYEAYEKLLQIQPHGVKRQKGEKLPDIKEQEEIIRKALLAICEKIIQGNIESFDNINYDEYLNKEDDYEGQFE